MTPADIVGYVVVLLGGGGLATIIKTIIDRRKVGPDAVALISKASADLVQSAQNQVNELAEDLAAARQETRDIRAENKELRSELEECHAQMRSILRELRYYREKYPNDPPTTPGMEPRR